MWCDVFSLLSACPSDAHELLHSGGKSAAQLPTPTIHQHRGCLYGLPEDQKMAQESRSVVLMGKTKILNQADHSYETGTVENI